jgi:hypothetical protein
MRKGNIDKTAVALGISQHRAHGVVAEGVLPKPRNGMHNIAKCRTLYQAYRLSKDKAYRIQMEREQLQRDLDAGKPGRWSIELAADEFGVSEKFLRRRLRAIGAQPC